MEVIDSFKAPPIAPMVAPLLEQKTARPSCPNCGSQETYRKGYRKTIAGLKPVSKCKNCRKKFTPEAPYLSPPWTTAPCIGCSCEHPGLCMKLLEWLLRTR